MDTQRLILFVVFSFSLLLLWEAWQKETRPPVAAVDAATQGTAAVPTPSSPTGAPSVKGAPVPPGTASAAGPSEHLRVSTDTMVAQVNTQGGNIDYLEFLQQKDAREETRNFVLFGPEHRYAAESGLIGAGLPNHRTPFRARGKEFALARARTRWK
jgi:YidC/Oxa1 family membrane protein insertase